MCPATHPLPETVIPRTACDCCSAAAYYERAGAEQPVDGLMAPIHRTILHAAIRIGRSFELVVECHRS